MRKFVPKSAAPIKRIRLSCRWRIHRKEFSKTHAEYPTDAWQAKRSNTEIIVVRIHLKADGALGLEAVFVGKRAVSFLEELGDIRPQHGNFLLMQLNLEMCRIESHEMFKTVEQHERVIGPLIE